MSDDKTTPGPWTVRRAPGGSQRFIIEGVSERGSGVWCLADVEGRSLEVNDANARLIAAAPDLLNALKAVVTEQAGGSFHRLTGDNAQAALAAIAKAEGR